MFRINKNRNGNIGSGISLPLSKFSTADIGAFIVSSPIVVNDTVFAGARDSSIYAFYNGSKLWSFKTRGWVDASPYYIDGELYAPSHDGLIYILNAATGESLGVINNGTAQSSSPFIYDSLIIYGAGGWSPNLMAKSLITGNYAWSYISSVVHSSPALKDSILCFGNNSGALTALNVRDGSLLWQYQTNGGVYLSTPAISGDYVFFSPGDYDMNLYAFSLIDGTLLWQNKSSNAAAKAVSSYALKKILPFKPSTRLKILGKMRTTGKISSYDYNVLLPLTYDKTAADPFVPLGGSATSSPAVGDSCVYVVHMEYGYPEPQFTITAFDKNNGSEKWTFTEMRNCEKIGFCASPFIADSIVFFGWGEGKFYAFNAFKGTKLWEDSLDGDILASPTAANGKVYVATTTGKIAAYQAHQATPAAANFNDGVYGYPNPARGNVSNIQYYVASPADVVVEIFNLAEKLIVKKTFMVTAQDIAGGNNKGKYAWNVSGVANGAYIARVTANYSDGRKESKIVKIAILK